jgi:hypothetical protein
MRLPDCKTTMPKYCHAYHQTEKDDGQPKHYHADGFYIRTRLPDFFELCLRFHGCPSFCVAPLDNPMTAVGAQDIQSHNASQLFFIVYRELFIAIQNVVWVIVKLFPKLPGFDVSIFSPATQFETAGF